jgi:hypothetical protein
MTAVNTTDFVSLYDVLGKAGGKELGKQLYAYAASIKSYRSVRFVHQGGYHGEVMIYPKETVQAFLNFKKRLEAGKITAR